jgi:uncharacterized protein YkwD
MKADIRGCYPAELRSNTQSSARGRRISAKSGRSISIRTVHGNHKNRGTAFSFLRIRGCLLALATLTCLWCATERLGAYPLTPQTRREGSQTSRPDVGASATEHVSGASLSIMVRNIEHYTNQERLKRGLVGFSTSPALAFLANGQSRNMCQAGQLIHESDRFPSGWKKFEQKLKRVGIRSGGENIAYYTTLKDPEKWARLVVRGWMNSPEHRKNILNPEYRYLGVGLEPCSNRIVYATQVFSSEIGRVSE